MFLCSVPTKIYLVLPCSLKVFLRFWCSLFTVPQNTLLFPCSKFYFPFCSQNGLKHETLGGTSSMHLCLDYPIPCPMSCSGTGSRLLDSVSGCPLFSLGVTNVTSGMYWCKITRLANVISQTTPWILCLVLC